MKKLIIAGIILLIIISIFGISYGVNFAKEYIEYQANNPIYGVIKDIIPDNSYKLDDDNKYEIIETDKGYDVVLHFISNK